MWRRSVHPLRTCWWEGGTFEIAALVLRYDWSVKFVLAFFYGHGVTGGVEAAFHNEGLVTPLGRLFMRSGMVKDWTFTLPGALFRPRQHLDKCTFFGLILAILP